MTAVAANILVAAAIASGCSDKGSRIDRYALVTRNNPHVTSIDTMASLTVGNGRFAFTAAVS